MKVKKSWAEILKEHLRGFPEPPFIDLTKPIEDVKHPVCDIVIDEDEIKEKKK